MPQLEFMKIAVERIEANNCDIVALIESFQTIDRVWGSVRQDVLLRLLEGCFDTVTEDRAFVIDKNTILVNDRRVEGLTTLRTAVLHYVATRKGVKAERLLEDVALKACKST